MSRKDFKNFFDEKFVKIYQKYSGRALRIFWMKKGKKSIKISIKISQKYSKGALRPILI